MVHTAGPSRSQPEFLTGAEWLLDGVLRSEAGVNLVVASRADPVPGILEAFRQFNESIDEAGIGLQMVEDDEVAAGLVRAGIGSGRHVLAVFDIRGLIRAFESIVDLSRSQLTERDAVVLAVCESRWRDFLDDRPPSATEEDGNHAPLRASSGAAIDFRRLSEYLALPVLAPASPPEVSEYVNEAIRLSRASSRPVALLLSPALVGGGESIWRVSDPMLRAVPSGLSELPDAEADPLLHEARRRQIDRVLNAPVPGEVTPLGFVTTGTAHAVLRHALNLVGMSGRCPILKVGLARPVDPRSLHQFLMRCREVIVIESGDAILEEAVRAEAQHLKQRSLECASIRSLLAPARQGQWRAIGMRPQLQQELHPSTVVEALAPVLESHPQLISDHVARLIDEQRVQHRSAVGIRRSERSRRPHSGMFDRAFGTSNTLIRPLMTSVLIDLREELLLPQAKHPSIRLRITSAETCSFEAHPNERTVVLLERRRLATLGRSIIAHAIRRRQPMTFLVLPAASPATERMRTGEADRMIRGMIADAESSFATVGTVDPADGVVLRETIRREVLADLVSILIVDTESHMRSENERRKKKADQGEDDEERKLTEHHVLPLSAESHLHLEWMIRRGYLQRDEQSRHRNPHIHPYETIEALASPLDAWDGFVECRVRRRNRPAAPAAEPAIPAPPRVQHAGEAFWRAHICGLTETSVRRASRLLAECALRMGYRVQIVQGRDRTSFFGQIVFSRPYPGKPAEPITPRIPFGAAHFVLALDVESLVSSTSADQDWRLASPGRTRMLLFHDVDQRGSCAPSIAGDRPGESGRPSSRGRDEIEILRQLQQTGVQLEVVSHKHAVTPVEFRDSDPGDLSVGFAFQRGWIPATVETLEKAAMVGIGDREEVNLRTARPGLVFGRMLAQSAEANALAGMTSRSGVRPDRGASAGSDRLSLRLPEQTIRRHAFVMSKRFRFHAHRRAQRFEMLAHAALDAMTGLRRHDPSRESERIFVDRLVDCEIWAGLTACHLYNDLVQRVYSAESVFGEFEVTRMVIPELGRAMIMTDAPFVCATFTRPDTRKWIRRLARFGVDPQDDFTFRLRGRIHSGILRAIFGPYWKFTPLTAAGVRHLQWVRTLPLVEREQKRYRAWVIGLVRRCAEEMPSKRSVWIEVFRQFERVHGPWPKRGRRIRGVRMAIQSLLDIADSDEGEDPDERSAESGTE